MIDITRTVTVTQTGLSIVSQTADAQLVVCGKILLLRKDHCVVLLSAGPKAGKKVQMPLTFPATIDGETYHVDAPATDVAPEAKAKRTRPAPGESKLDKCKAIFAANREADKATVIKMFVEQAQCTPAGANTYYLTCKKTV